MQHCHFCNFGCYLFVAVHVCQCLPGLDSLTNNCYILSRVAILKKLAFFDSVSYVYLLIHTHRRPTSEMYLNVPKYQRLTTKRNKKELKNKIRH